MKAEDFINQEISTYEIKLETLAQLKVKVKEAVNDLADSYSGIINAKEKFEIIKKQNIEELRLYRFSVKSECDEIKKQIETIKSISETLNVNDLSSFVKCCEQLNSLQNDGFFERINIIKPVSE